MGATYTRQSSSGITDGAVIEASDLNNEFDQLLAAFVAASGHTHDGTAAEGGPITKLLGTSITIGDGTSGTDIAVTFDGESADGVLTWMEDEDYFKFSDEVLMNSTEKLLFGDTGTYIHQSADGVLDLVSDTEIEINATTIDINGAVAMDGAITGATNITLSGELDAATLDISGNADIDGTLEADAITINGTAIGSIYGAVAGSSSIVTTGALDSGSITSGFGTIDTGSSTITTTGLISGGSLDIDNVLINGTTIGHTDDTDLMTVADGVLTVAGEVDATTLDISGNADIDGTTNLDAVDIDGAVQLDATFTVGADDQGYDVKLFGDTASAYMLWDTSADDLILGGAAGLIVPDGQFTLGSTAVSATAAEINLIDGGTARGTTAVADGDGLLVNDAGTMRMTNVTTLKTYFQSGVGIAADDISAGDGAVTLSTSSGNITIDATANDTDIIFKGTDNSSDITMLTLDGSDAGTAIFNNDVSLDSDSAVLKFGDDQDVTLTHTDGTGLTLNSTSKLTFGDAATYINQSSDGVMTVAGEATIDLTASTAVLVSNDLKLDSDSAVLGFGADNDTTLTHTDGTGLTLNSTNKLTFNDTGTYVGSNADGDLDVVSDGTAVDSINIESAGGITLDAGTAASGIIYEDDGTEMLRIHNSSSDVIIEAKVQDKDIIFKGDDGGSGVTALTLDMSAGGIATFGAAANVAQGALTSSSNAVAWDALDKPNAYHQTSENTTFSAPSNAVEGAFICIEINYNGSHTIAWNTVFEFAASTEATETATDGKTDIHIFRYNGAVWQEVGRTLNLAES
jgi:cytoskeletal protein CcmA (bactofilin family)